TKISKTRGSDDAALSRWSALWRRAQILRRPRHRVPELAGGAQREVRIAQQLPCHEHAVGLAARDDLVRLRRVCDQTHRTGRDAGLASNALGEWHLVSGPERNFRIGDAAARRAIDQIGASRLQPPRELDGLL